ncbi:MAG: histidinol dehydrogenase, partial [Actinobacteria bacterium]|nr:histidinol dehydrogenase [Actinomycetota bacterium]
MSGLLRRVGPSEVGRRRAVIDPETMSQAVAIVEDVRTGGEAALRHHSGRLGDTAADEKLVYPTDELEDVFGGLEAQTRDLLERTASRIRWFAEAQRATLHDLDTEVTGGRGGHRWVPVESVGAYAPGGRHPLPSSVLMTVVPARVAGVGEVWVASPRPTELTMAAAWVAGADGLLAVGGAQGIAALAFGTASPPCDLI